MTDIRKCCSCGQVHDCDERCGTDARALQILSDEDLNQLPDPLWDIADMTHEAGFEVGYAPTSAGKTTFYTQRAFAKATGTTFLGFNVLRRGKVLCLVFEGVTAFKKKIRALKKAAGLANEQIGIHTVIESVNLLQVEAAYRIVKTHEAIGGVDEIIIDNLTCSTLGQEENEHMAVVAAHVNIVRDYTGARVVVIHHEGKNHQRGARGGSALVGFADTALRLSENTNGHTLHCAKQRDGAKFAPVFLKLTPTADGSTALFERFTEGPVVSLLGDKARDKAKLQIAVLALVRDHPGATTSAIAVGKRRQDVTDALVALEQAGRVRVERKGQAKLWTAIG